MEGTKYSVITPVFNRADSIGRCIESVNKCVIEGNEIEHIVVDDGSSDDTVAIVEQYAKQYGHIKFIKFPHNRGTNAARNAAIAAARGEWCIILDSDDYFVNNAIGIISSTMEGKPGYKHYMFAADDMQPYYTNNAVIRGRKQCVLTYPDFLNGYVDADFIHVCNTEILRNHPFDESLRTYEGLFFLMFYREAQKILFTNEVVTIRERSRADSVTRTHIRTSVNVIERKIKSSQLLLKTFGEEMENLGMNRRLNAIRIGLLDNLLLMEKYDDAYELYAKLKPIASRKHRIILFLRLGGFYRFALKVYLNTKYKVLKKNLS